jgi:BA14K-like protein
MEPTMISLKVLSTVAAMALVLPMVAPSASFAQFSHDGKGGGVAHGGGGGGSPAPAARFSGGGGGSPGQRFSGGGGGGGNWHGGGGYRRGGDGFIPGAVIGGALASGGYGYYGGPGYYAQGYYDDQYYDDGAVAVAPDQGSDDSVAYCMQTYRSYDPRSGTYMGIDGYRHPCP